MGTILNAIAINNSTDNKGVVEFVSKTADLCLSKAGLSFGDVGMLINTGVYSENHLIEPALATLVHKELLKKSNSTRTLSKQTGKMLSFDLHNGGGGIINAIQVIDGFIGSNEIKNGLIFCGDVKPETGIVEHYDYSKGAAAILLSKDKNKQGFLHFRTETFLRFKEDFSSTTRWENGTLKFKHAQKSNYLANTIDCTTKVLHNFFKEEGIAWDEIDLVCTSQSPKGFARALQKKLKVKEKIIHLQNEKEIYSSGLLYSLHQVFEKEVFKRAKNVLFVTVGAGITVSLAYYKNEK